MANDQKEKVLQEICSFPVPSDDKWYEAVERSIKGKPFETLTTPTREEITLQPLYRRGSASLDFAPPGRAPYRRGAENNQWEITQTIRESTPARFYNEANEDMQNGQTWLGVKLHPATKRGEIPQLSSSRSEGLPLSDLEDVKVAFGTATDLPLFQYPLYVETGANPLPLYLLFKAANETTAPFKGVIAGDPLGEAAIHGKLPCSVNEAIQGAVAVFKDTNGGVRSLLVSAEPYHTAGSSAVEEVSYALATGVYYVKELRKKNLSFSEIKNLLAFVFPLGQQQFMEIAKIRAFRELWANIMEAFGADDQEQQTFIHGVTSMWSKTKVEPYVNILRTAAESFTGAVACVNSMDVVPFDVLLQKPTSFSRRVARNTQLIMKEEAYLAHVSDPAGGSHYIETLTNQLAEKAWLSFQEIEKQGGMLEVLENGAIQTHLLDMLVSRKTAIQQRKEVFVGVNNYFNPDDRTPPAPSDDSEERKAYDQEKEMGRSYEQLNDVPTIALENLQAAVQQIRTSQAPLPALFAGCHREEKVQWEEVLTTSRGSEAFEQLQKRVQDSQCTEAEGRGKTSVFLLNIGPIPHHKPRADFARSVFQAGSFAVESTAGFSSIEEAVAAVKKTNAEVIVICGRDKAYADWMEKLLPQLSKSTPEKMKVLAGKPEAESLRYWQTLGLEDIIYQHMNVWEKLHHILDRKGVEPLEKS
ncbi:methylmalonyl-CoA mutase family protein [Salsuginibacillus kocurii]|uniref:methylmalonyl-CoA mutase family protein n=1 Tax=Salsuginibacillus kocurii TaxID=427078 RepID=UPI0003601B3A|nr:methylmalonyl-CoA mutase family protein [Salsuginibacillus kocurii]